MSNASAASDGITQMIAGGDAGFECRRRWWIVSVGFANGRMLSRNGGRNCNWCKHTLKSGHPIEPFGNR